MAGKLAREAVEVLQTAQGASAEHHLLGCLRVAKSNWLSDLGPRTSGMTSSYGRPRMTKELK